MPRAAIEQVNNSCINLDGEEWRDVPGYESIYKVSNFGRVKHKPTTVVEFADSGDIITSRKTREYILKQCVSKDEYIKVGLVKDGHINSIGVHRLIALAFIPRLPSQTQVHHIDRNRQNNSIDNLKWLSPEEHRLKHKTRPDFGKRNKPAVVK